MSGYQWNGRDVEFVEFDIAAGERIVDLAVSEDKKAASYTALVLSARYVDDGTPVFTSVDEIRALPFRLVQRVQRLAAGASQRNQIEVVEGDDDAPLDAARADVSASARAGNGALRQ